MRRLDYAQGRNLDIDHRYGDVVAARARGVAVLTEEVATDGELASAFARFGKQGVQAVIVPVNGLFFSRSMQIAQLALAARLPTADISRPACSHPTASTGRLSRRSIA